MNDLPLVSIVIPTYGRSELLPKAVESALNQTYKRTEIFVVDDNDSGSEHRAHTERALQPYTQSKQITYLKHNKNRGGSAARNTGIKASQGKYVALLDDDDEWFPEKIEKQVRYFEVLDQKVGVIYCSYILQEYDGDVEMIRYEKGDLTKELLMLEFDPGASSTLMFRRDVLDEINYFDERFARHQDLEILIRLCRKYLIDVCSDVLLRINGHNFPSPRKSEQVQQLFFKVFDNDIRHLAFWEQRHVYAKHYMQLASLYFNEKMMRQVAKYYIKSILTLPRMIFDNKINVRMKLFIMKRLGKKVS